MTDPLLQVENIRMIFPVATSFLNRERREIHAVDNVGFSIEAGQTLGLVGESGCGKTTLGRIVARLTQPTSGRIIFEGHDITHLKRGDLRHFRRHVQMVFQDPYTSLNPRLSIANIIAEPLHINRWGSRRRIQARVEELLDAVGLSVQDSQRRPHEFSGGQRQRIAIARALALEPKLVVCDEPVSALDMSIQAKILNLLVDLQKRFNLTYFFISHDLSVVRLIADHVAVMYMGQIVEEGAAETVFANPLHPYTAALMAAVPDPYQRTGIQVLAGEVPSNIHLPPGCRFHTRCPARMDICDQQMPALAGVDAAHHSACFLHHKEVTQAEFYLDR